MVLVVHNTVQAHPAVIAPAPAAVGAAAAIIAWFITTFLETVAAVRTGLIIIIMAFEAGISTAGVTPAAAIKTTMADQTAFILGTCSAVGAMLAFINSTILAHMAVFAVVSHTVRAGAAGFTLGVVIINVAFSAIRACEIFVEMALQA